MCHYNGRVGITKGVHLLDHLINNYTTSSHSPNGQLRRRSYNGDALKKLIQISKNCIIPVVFITLLLTDV
ncbi:hypothetical protein QTP88_028693 [Uroleucon formosanum]